MDELSLDNILTGEEISELFDAPEDINEPSEVLDDKQKTKEPETTEVNIDDLFSEEPESVGSEDNDIKEKEDTASKVDKTSPDFYSSIANALVEDGIFQNLDEEALANIQSAEDFANVISEQIKSQFDERQKRIDDALNYGIEPSEIQKYERLINYLETINEDNISDETETGETLRKNLIYQDYLNRGFSKERAAKAVERSFKAGTDIEDAKEALQSNKEYYNDQYDELVEEAKEEERKVQEKYKKQAEDLRASILNSDKAFGEIDLDKTTRQKVYDSIMKPVYTDPKTGEKLTAIQKLQSENSIEYLKNVGLFYVLTDGFKKLDGLVQGRVKKEVKKGLRELENTLNGTSRNSGNLRFTSGVGGDPESRSSKWEIDV